MPTTKPHQSLNTASLYASVAVLGLLERGKARHRRLRDDRGVVSIEYVLIAAAAAAIAIAIGTMIWQAVKGVAGEIQTDVVDPDF